MQNDLDFLINSIISSNAFWIVNYYMSCMKKQPHGGIAKVCCPNYYLKYHHKEMFRLFIHNNANDVPIFLQNITDEAYTIYMKLNVDIDELLMFCFDDDSFWYAGMRLLTPKEEYIEENKNNPIIWKVISSKLSFKEYFIIEEKKAVYALICFLLDNNMIEVSGLKDIVAHESLVAPHNKYGLTIIENAKFLRQGFIYEDKYYLYNIFFDTSIGAPMDEIPYTIKVICDEIPGYKLAMRLDNNIAIPPNKIVSTATVDFQVFRGITLDFVDINSMIRDKEVIVHFSPETMNKVIMIIKPDKEEDLTFYHIEVEELWNKEIVKDSFILTNFIHAKYYPATQSFNHVDFSVNQYDTETYKLKYDDAVNKTGVPIDKYCLIHYKVWCVEHEEISIKTWSNLVSLTLDEPFRDLFFDMFNKDI